MKYVFFLSAAYTGFALQVLATFIFQDLGTSQTIELIPYHKASHFLCLWNCCEPGGANCGRPKVASQEFLCLL